MNLEGTEFSGGKLTGPLLHMSDIGTLLFVIALLLVWFFRRVAATVSLIGALLCLPLFLFFTVPGLFYHLFNRYEFKVPLRANVVWNSWAVLGILAVVMALYLNLRSFTSKQT
jgi:hypothetical protein